MSALTKDEIMDEIVSNTSLERSVASEGIEQFLEIIKKTLAGGENVSLSGFGKFDVRNKRARRGRNPQTGEEIVVKERRVITFDLSNVLRAKLEGKR